MILNTLLVGTVVVLSYLLRRVFKKVLKLEEDNKVLMEEYYKSTMPDLRGERLNLDKIKV